MIEAGDIEGAHALLHTILTQHHDELTEEQQLLRKTVREFAETEIGPHAREWDEAQAWLPDGISPDDACEHYAAILERTLAVHHEQVAAVVMEPFSTIPPSRIAWPSCRSPPNAAWVAREG